MVWCVVLVTVLVSCGQKREVSEVGYTDHAVIDSLFDSPDSLLFPSRGADEELPERADELFDDFIFEFARLKKLQLARVKFPLPSIANGDTTWLTEEQWRYEPLFRGHDYYTVFYNDEEQMDMEKRTDLEVVEVEQIHLEKRLVKVCQMAFDPREVAWLHAGISFGCVYGFLSEVCVGCRFPTIERGQPFALCHT